MLLRILVVDDNEINRRVACAILERLGHVVVSAGSGNEALGLHGRDRFDLILLDCHMPGIDGFECARKIRESEMDRQRHTPIVAFTADTSQDVRDRCRAIGMDDFLPKPVRLEAFRAMLLKWFKTPLKAAA